LSTAVLSSDRPSVSLPLSLPHSLLSLSLSPSLHPCSYFSLCSLIFHFFLSIRICQLMFLPLFLLVVCVFVSSLMYHCSSSSLPPALSPPPARPAEDIGHTE